MNRVLVAATLLALTAARVSASEVKITLRGSHASMERQNRIARDEMFAFLRTNRDVARFADAGMLVPVPGNQDYVVLAEWPYARPVVRDFVALLAREYREACGEQLVVTSLTRPTTRQPGNASPLSVHPAGMAADLRVSGRTQCVKWLGAELLRLEAASLLDATREYHPPHFHVAVFPEAFNGYLADRAADSVQIAAVGRDSSALLQSVAAISPAVLTTASVQSHQANSGWTPATLLGDLLAIVGRLLLRV